LHACCVQQACVAGFVGPGAPLLLCSLGQLAFGFPVNYIQAGLSGCHLPADSCLPSQQWVDFSVHLRAPKFFVPFLVLFDPHICALFFLLVFLHLYPAPMFPLTCSFFPIMFPTGILIFKLASCPVGTEAASLEMAKAYCNSPICPAHKKYLCVYWRDGVYIQHVAIEGLATAGGIQGNVADATIALLKYHRMEPTIKWVDDFVFFHCPTLSPPPSAGPSFSFDLSTIYDITTPLGIPWHPLSKKGHNFQSCFSYIGF